MSQRYDTYLQVRLTTHDKERIKARALEAGLKTSEYVRERALGEPGRFGLVDFGPTNGETMYEGHPAVVEARESSELDASGSAGETLTPEQARQKQKAGQLERHIRGSVSMQAPRNEP